MNDGGPAFPTRVADFTQTQFGGVTVRDYFAIRVLNGLVTNGKIPSNKLDVAACAYDYADAMLAARKKNLTHKSTTE